MRKLVIIVGLAFLIFWAVGSFSNDTVDKADTKTTQKASSQATKKPTFNKKQYSLSDPASVWVVVNKKRPLDPLQFMPADLVKPSVAARNDNIQLRKDANNALGKLFAAADANKTPLRLSSGYRSYNYQVGLYNTYVSREGKAAADAESARPGYSEHQTGLAVDVGPYYGECNVEACFADTPSGKWLAANSYKYGFIIRYPSGKTSVTGYEYEPWHIRYVGVDLATEMHTQGISTMEEFFGLPAAPDY